MSPVSNTSARQGTGVESNLPGDQRLSHLTIGFCYRPKTALFGPGAEKCTKIGKAKPAPRLRSKSQNSIRPRSITKSDFWPKLPLAGPGAGLARAWRVPGAGLVPAWRAWCGPGAGLARAWCGPGAGLVLPFCQSCVSAGLLRSILCQRRIASPIPALTAGLPRRTTSSSGLEPFLPAPSGRPGHAPFPRSCCAAGRTSRRPGARRGLSECPAGGD